MQFCCISPCFFNFGRRRRNVSQLSSCLNLAKYDLRGQKTVQNKTPCIKKITFIGSWQNQCILSEYTYVIRIQSLGHCIPQLVFYICSCTESMACQDTQILHMSLILSPLQFYNSYTGYPEADCNK